MTNEFVGLLIYRVFGEFRDELVGYYPSFSEARRAVRRRSVKLKMRERVSDVRGLVQDVQRDDLTREVL